MSTATQYKSKIGFESLDALQISWADFQKIKSAYPRDAEFFFYSEDKGASTVILVKAKLSSLAKCRLLTTIALTGVEYPMYWGRKSAAESFLLYYKQWIDYPLERESWKTKALRYAINPENLGKKSDVSDVWLPYDQTTLSLLFY